MNQASVDPKTWRERCALRISELDPQLSEIEAREIAADFEAFERTGVMAPEAAAEFVVYEMSRPDSPRFERRLRIRAPGAPRAS